MGAAAPVLAQTSPQAYGGIGFTSTDANGHGLHELTGRAGVKLNPYVGVEGEIGSGLNENHFTTASGAPAGVRNTFTGAGYVVGFYPVTPQFDVLARVGYGATDVKREGAGLDPRDTAHSFNYGAGAQYFLDGKNGIRVDYTRRDFQEPTAPKDADAWSVGYIRKF
jgi:hypothetical protein